MKKVKNVFKSQKLIRVFLEYDEYSNTIHAIRITGDFFVYPEDSIEKLERSLIGSTLEKDVIKQRIEAALKDSEVFGFDHESMTEAILGCVNEFEY